MHVDTLLDRLTQLGDPKLLTLAYNYVTQRAAQCFYKSLGNPHSSKRAKGYELRRRQ